MKREIKFRAWCDKGNQMHTPCEVYTGENGELYTRTGYQDETGYHYNIHSNIQQFTGLRDKNGKEIYEGDVCKCIMIGFETHQEEVITEVIYDATAGGFGQKVISKDSDYILFGLNSTNLIRSEIIGNIHETPELLPKELAA